MNVISMPDDEIRYPDIMQKTRRFLWKGIVALPIGMLALYVVSLFIPHDLVAGDLKNAVGSASLILLFLILVVVSGIIWGAANDSAKCCNCKSPIMVTRYNWLKILAGLLPVCKKCSDTVGAEFIKPLPANPVYPVNPVMGTPANARTTS